MFQLSRLTQWGVLVAIVVLSLMGSVAKAAPPAVSANGVGVVEFDAIFKDYDGLKVAMQRLEATYTTLSGPLEIMKNGRGLNKDDYAAYMKLANQPARDEAKITEFTNKATANVALVTALQEKKQKDGKLSDADQAQLDALMAEMAPIESDLTAESQKLQSEMMGMQQKYQAVIMGEVQAAISQIAKAQKLSVVINKSMQSENGSVATIVLWNDDSVNITTKVLKELNSKFKPTMFDEKPASTVDEKPTTTKDKK